MMGVHYARIAALLVASQMATVVCADEFRLGRPVAHSLRHVRFFIGKGRIQASPTYLAARNIRDSARTSRSAGSESGDSESVSLVVHQGVPTIKYVRSRPTMTLTIEMTDGDRLVIKRESNDPATTVPLRFEQPSEADLRLSVGTDADGRTIQARSLWQLLLAEPELCRRELVPILTMLRPDWRLMETAVAVEKSLLEIAASRTAEESRRMRVLIGRLGDNRFAERRAAQRELERLGEAALPYLLALNPRLLDAEQRQRVRRLTDRMTSRAPTNTMHIAAQLSADRDVWLSLMDRSQAAERRLAAKQLADLLGQTIEFDAEADEETRASQLRRLRLEMAKRPTPSWK